MNANGWRCAACRSLSLGGSPSPDGRCDDCVRDGRFTFRRDSVSSKENPAPLPARAAVTEEEVRRFARMFWRDIGADMDYQDDAMFDRNFAGTMRTVREILTEVRAARAPNAPADAASAGNERPDVDAIAARAKLLTHPYVLSVRRDLDALVERVRELEADAAQKDKLLSIVEGSESRRTEEHDAVRAERYAAHRVIEAARKMPRRTPTQGSASTIHPYYLSAADVWALDLALSDYDAARTAHASEPLTDV